MKKEDAVKMFDVSESTVSEFEVQDPFNPNMLHGFITVQSDHKYGAIIIDKINNIPCAPQLVYGAPKLHYPFDKSGRFHFPDFKRVEIYEKLDGTSIVGYTYTHKKKLFVSYKIRRHPVVGRNRFGDFLSMTKEMLLKYPEIDKFLLENPDLTLAFELYGNRNHHLIYYNVGLDLKLLFAIRQKDATVVSIEDFKKKYPEHNIPLVDTIEDIRSCNDLVTFYKKHQGESEATNKKVDGGIEGTEGYVYYVKTIDDLTSFKMFKCKPESVEKIHWSMGGLGRRAVIATTQNALESCDKLTVDYVKELLSEEFMPDKIKDATELIKECIVEVLEAQQFKMDVFEKYKKIGINIKEDKGSVMREMSKHFSKYKIRAVYSLIKNG